MNILKLAIALMIPFAPMPLKENKEPTIEVEEIEYPEVWVHNPTPYPEVIEEPEPEVIAREVTLTNFYPNDSLGTTAVTSTGHMPSELGTNEYGHRTYEGKVVVAAATNVCLQVTTGPCAKYNYLPEGYESYDLYDELQVNFKGVWLDAIVLSSCGACFWERETQTYDIMIDPSFGKFGKIQGSILPKEN